MLILNKNIVITISLLVNLFLIRFLYVSTFGESHHSYRSHHHAEYSNNMKHSNHYMTTKEVSADAGLIPTISLLSTKDSMSGYNIELVIENFELSTPIENNEDTSSGHAHVYVDNEKVMRVYSNNFHIPGDLLDQSESTLRVDLNTHNHQTLTYKSILISDTIQLQNN